MLVVSCALGLNPTYPPFIKPVVKTNLGMLQLREKYIFFFLISLPRRGTFL